MGLPELVEKTEESVILRTEDQAASHEGLALTTRLGLTPGDPDPLLLSVVWEEPRRIQIGKPSVISRYSKNIF